MAASSRRDAKQPSAPAPTAPPYYIAIEALFIGGNQFARAFNPGDRVPVEHVETHGWADKVRPPDGYDSPQQTSDEPDAKGGQATSKEGDV
ncbi:hypothetical protein MF672_038760 [Actinomadura sp. ATCC 31491]|uniref:ATP-grasp-modified RiPP n=1 Tax=Actinomadura luzonensis TaxID=2805427 RepID=A0ABT0G514_9ACTN|nr:hypothetical protein [Actinomadura luzonensis]MCK2219696.1 hypothetical protein [Actinomadura luzonensis]